MTPQQHHFFNQLLNDRVQKGKPPVLYEHRYETDEFFEAQGGRIRLTKHTKTNDVGSKARIPALELTCSFL